MTTACRKFEGFVSRFQPYFDVVEIFVQVKPEYMALIWGSLKLIFKVRYLIRSIRLDSVGRLHSLGCQALMNFLLAMLQLCQIPRGDCQHV
jgi:hypothetical protein